MQKRKDSCTFKRETFLVVQFQERIYSLWHLQERGERVTSGLAGGAERRKADWPLHSEAVRRTLTVGQESKKEIPVYISQTQ
jgi:hypothetical protein